MARPGKGEFMRLGRLLEAGAHGILYPRCESAAEAREAVRWAKFPPLGERGFDGGNADNAYGACPAGDYVAAANRETWLAVQVETPVAVEHAAEIAAVPGVDVLFFGPGDYSCAIGKPGQVTDPDVLAAARRTADAARAAGRVFGTLAFGPAHRAAVLAMGCRLLGVGADQGLLARAMRDLADACRDEAAPGRRGAP
jgi:4-hydroxy-2-oxoheptanedioate aldolase